MKCYCYTKSVSRFRRLVEPDPPDNFLWCYSLGDKEDHLLDLEEERHSDVFPGVAEVESADYHDQTESDLLAVLGPKKVGIPAWHPDQRETTTVRAGPLHRARPHTLRADVRSGREPYCRTLY